MVKEYPKEHWHSVHTNDMSALPIVSTPFNIPDLHRLLVTHLGKDNASAYEIGCVPGRYLAYFSKYMGMQVAGVDYVEEGVELTRENLRIQGINADIQCADFFSYDPPDAAFDVVFSGGFIEHWDDTQAVVKRIVSIGKEPGGFVVTTVPNLVGLRGALAKRLAPESFAAHVPISAERLRAVHENANVQTLFCGYAEAPGIFLPKIKRNHKNLGGIVTRAVAFVCYLINGCLKRTCQYTGWFPRTRWFSPWVVYIGRR